MIPYKAKKATKKIDPKISNPPPTRPLCDACENFLHQHSQTLAPTGRESPQTGAFGDQHAPELREHEDNQHGDQFASGTAHRLPPGRGNGIHGGSTDTEHLVGEATLGLQPGQELR